MLFVPALSTRDGQYGHPAPKANILAVFKTFLRSFEPFSDRFGLPEKTKKTIVDTDKDKDKHKIKKAFPSARHSKDEIAHSLQYVQISSREMMQYV